MPALTATPYPSQAAPPVARGGDISGAGRRGGLSGIATTFIIIIVCLLIGGGIYYFVNQNGTSSPTNNTVDITPPSIQNVKISATTATGATITWKTDEPATSQVRVLDSSDAIIIETDPKETLATSHSATLSGLEPGTTYKYTVISTDDAGNETTSKGELTTLTTADETPPTISGVGVSNITQSSATITWVTDEPATSQVEYGETETYGSETTENTNLSTSHSVTLTGLDDGTTYNFQVISKDGSGNSATSPTNQTFETPAVIPVGYEKGNRAPDFTLQDLNGQDVKLSSLRGKIVMVNFWAIWCVPCKEELPYFQAISDNRSQEDLKILAVNFKEGTGAVRSFITGEEYTFTVLLDSTGEVNTLYDVSYYPTTFFIDADGIIKEIQEGSFQSQTEIENILDSL
jgi:peroxiredoxin